MNSFDPNVTFPVLVWLRKWTETVGDEKEVLTGDRPDGCKEIHLPPYTNFDFEQFLSEIKFQDCIYRDRGQVRKGEGRPGWFLYGPQQVGTANIYAHHFYRNTEPYAKRVHENNLCATMNGFRPTCLIDLLLLATGVERC